ncbi:competence/damage-inducible protein A [Rhodoflexus caldus]|uniref:competence/damage-inducible protein A n=1 Tax=Rhodoflexus caldus TaxID=2891236 RepID=UPI00202AB19B|nr:competence/damage-inducible protein A [Rhodoflexus caldus]
MKQVLAEIITIGDEILYGQITDTNSQWISAELDKIGVRTIRKTSVGDNQSAIVNALQAAEAVADIILITGGLGPTKDDITKRTLADYFGTELVFDQSVLDNITRLFSARGREVTPTNRQQAYVPANCKVLQNLIGTAPGMWFEHHGKVFVSMAGVPYEMKKMMKEAVLPMLQERFETPHIIHRMIKTINIPESTLSDMIEEWELALPPHLKLAYLPRMGQVRLRITGIGKDRDALLADINRETEKVVAIIGKHFYGYDDDEIETTVAALLLEQGKTIATAESCTGGYIAHQFTQHAGSSRYFVGGIVAYSNEVKVSQLGVLPETLAAHGAVSEETVRQMAENVRVRYGASIGIATTGIAGPNGGTPEKPVGTVWIGYADGTQVIAKKLALSQERSLNISLTSNAVLDLVRKQLSL